MRQVGILLALERMTIQDPLGRNRMKKEHDVDPPRFNEALSGTKPPSMLPEGEMGGFG